MAIGQLLSAMIYHDMVRHLIWFVMSLTINYTKSDRLIDWAWFYVCANTIYRVHSKLKGQNSRTFQGLLKDLKLQFSSTKSVDKKHTILTLLQNLEWNTALMIKADCWYKIICNPCETMKIWSSLLHLYYIGVKESCSTIFYLDSWLAS